jgi:hypothetical protein
MRFALEYTQISRSRNFNSGVSQEKRVNGEQVESEESLASDDVIMSIMRERDHYDYCLGIVHSLIPQFLVGMLDLIPQSLNSSIPQFLNPSDNFRLSGPVPG